MVRIPSCACMSFEGNSRGNPRGLGVIVGVC